MKKKMYFLLLLAFVGFYTPAKAFLVNIPDANFRARLQTLYPACFVGTQMETTCGGITSAIFLNVSGSGIANLSGVEYFVNLQTLACSSNVLTNFPTLPANLLVLSCGFNQFTNLPALPTTLQTLNCGYNSLTSLPTLPTTLQALRCNNNLLTSLPPLPNTLQILNCGFNQLGIFFNTLTLPPNLQYLHCQNNQITNLPVPPPSLTELNCDNNSLDFADLEAINPKPTIYVIGSQLRRVLPDARLLTTGATLIINGGIGGSLNVYQWYKDNILIPSANSAIYTKNSINGTDAGVYHCLVTSTYVGAGTTTGVSIYVGGVGVCIDAVISTTSLPNVTINTPYNQTMTQTGLIGAVTWSVSVGVLPTGLTINASTGVISGTPTALGTSNFTVSVMNVVNGFCVPIKALSITVTSCPIITITPTPTVLNYVVGTAISNITLGASSASTATYTYAVTNGGLPAGVTLTNGLISGIPTTAVVSGSFTITATATIGTCTGTQTYSYGVICPTIVFNNTVATNAITGVPYTLNPNITGNTAALTCTISPSLVGSGLNFNTSTGVISGTPTGTVFSTTYTITATQGGCSQSRNYVFGVSCPIISFVNTTTTPSFIGNPYSLNVSVTGNTQPVTYTVDLTLPSGLSLNPTTGIISGTPTAIIPSALYTITAIQGVGAGSCGNLRTYLIAVSCPGIIFATTTASNGIVGASYTLNAGATGAASLTYSVNPALPAGLSLNTTTGIISGTPTTAKISTTYVVTANQSGICGNTSPTQSYTFAITENPATAIDNSLSNLVKVSPNPSKGDFQVDFSGLNVAKSLVRVYDAQGKQVLSSVINANANTTISLDKMPNGLYLLEIETTKGRILKRLIKEN